MSNHSPIYLDHAAATQLDPAVFKKMEPYFKSDFYNPSATYTAALEVRRALEAARSKVAYWLGAQSSEVVFTAGGTEANNLAIHGIMRNFPSANIVISTIEHESVIVPASNYDLRLVPVLPDGSINLAELRRNIDKNTVLVSVMYANNEIGTVQPIREISQLISEIKTERRTTNQDDQHLPIYLHTDACQAANYLDLHTARLGLDLMTLNGGKMYGPKQSGTLYVKRGLRLKPLIEGGGQESGIRSGTENVAGAVGFAAALDEAQIRRKDETIRLQKLQAFFFEELSNTIPSARINGSLKQRLPNNVHLTLDGQDNERLLIELDERGVQAAAGSACSASNEEPSHVLRALGLSDHEAQSSIRCSMGRETTEAMIERTLVVLRDILQLT